MYEPRTLNETLGIIVTKQDKYFVEATMAIRPGISQMFGYVHGGATLALLETVASIGSTYWYDPETEVVFGIESHVRHWKSGKNGMVRGVAEYDRSEGDKQYWNITAYDDEGDVMSSGTFVTKKVTLERLAEKERGRQNGLEGE